jgi:two-component system response regulator NreC
MPTRILIADDHRMYREGLRALLHGDDLEVVAEASDGREAIRLATRHQPDIALVDISMSGLNGLDVTREVLRASPRSRVIVLTMHKDDAYVIDALRAGASGYVLKSQGFAELLQAIREVARGEVYVAKECWRPLVESYQSGEDLAHDPLSRREREVLQLVAEGKTTKEIAGALSISVKTAESHRGRVMAKLDIHDTASLVRYAIRARMIEA